MQKLQGDSAVESEIPYRVQSDSLEDLGVTA
jgi:hypothetical protein